MFRVASAIPKLGLQRGDYLFAKPGRPVAVLYELPDGSDTARAIEEACRGGALELAGGIEPAARLTELPAIATHSALTVPAAPSKPPALRLVR